MDNRPDSGTYTRGLVLGTLLGGVAGAVTALLIAPKSGSELRKEIAETSSGFYNKASDYASNLEQDVSKTAASAVNEGRTRAQNIINNARTQAEELLSRAEGILNDARTKTTDAKGQMQDRIDNIRDAAKASADAFKTEMQSHQEK